MFGVFAYLFVSSEPDWLSQVAVSVHKEKNLETRSPNS